MNALRRPPTVTLARIVLGGIFVYLGALKALDPVAFLKLVRQFEVVPTPPGLNAIAALLPWFEIFCGALLLIGVKVRAAALVQLTLLAGFTGLVLWRSLAIYRSGGVPFCAIHFDCGCGTGEVLICMKLLENLGLMALAAFVALRSARP
jgi:uncharacterized membrane protein YphA (DoxX/SURF4 family)